MMGRVGIISLLVSFLIPLAYADTISVYHINESPGVFLQTTLTHDIYRYSLDSQLNDLVVTDNQGNKLPSRIIVATTHKSEKKYRVPVKFFPVTAGVKPETWISPGKTLIRIDENALSISIDKSKLGDEASQPVAADFYLLDLRELTTPVDSLSLDWQTAESNQYLEVQVSGTSDLQNWMSLAQETLVHLQKDNQTLVRNQIYLGSGNNTYDYLRIKFLPGGEKIQVLNIYAQTKTHTANAVPADAWRVHGQLAEDQDSILRTGGNDKASSVAAWEYQRDDRAPVNKLQLALGSSAYGDSISVFSRAREKQPWKLIHRGIWFNAQVGSAWQHSDYIKISANSDSHWRVELNKSMREKVTPEIIFEHPPHTLEFIANNAAPYRIAIDRQTASANHHANAQIFSQLVNGKNPNWIQVSFSQLSPETSSFAHPVAETNWKIFLFWGMLLIAVTVLIGFAIRLYRQME